MLPLDGKHSFSKRLVGFDFRIDHCPFGYSVLLPGLRTGVGRPRQTSRAEGGTKFPGLSCPRSPKFWAGGVESFAVPRETVVFPSLPTSRNVSKVPTSKSLQRSSQKLWKEGGVLL